MTDQNDGANSRGYNGSGDDSQNKRLAMHYRRCHVCNEVSEVETGTVKHCGSCGKAMAPFFFFEEIETPVVSEFELRPAYQLGTHPPVRGLTAYW